VLETVLQRIEQDICVSPDDPDDTKRLAGECARLVHGHVDRKVIKQTVMTSVYGVTRTGARAQIQARLEEKFQPDSSQLISVELDKQLFSAATYLAGLSLLSLDLLFSSAKGIMNWLGACSKLVSSQNQAMSWVTPLGLPVIQPYRQERRHVVRTVLQVVTLTSSNENLPVSTQKQKSAFPPNFVHSLDASHMLMTSLLMKTKRLSFAAVHDSYWTHACDVDTMNASLRECFVELYQYPVLEDLRDSLVMRFPDINFPPIPARGLLDIKLVNDSTYFFH
jgi:DNA-directed RNA polymerase